MLSNIQEYLSLSLSLWSMPSWYGKSYQVFTIVVHQDCQIFFVLRPTDEKDLVEKYKNLFHGRATDISKMDSFFLLLPPKFQTRVQFKPIKIMASRTQILWKVRRNIVNLLVNSDGSSPNSWKWRRLERNSIGTINAFCRHGPSEYKGHDTYIKCVCCRPLLGTFGFPWLLKIVSTVVYKPLLHTSSTPRNLHPEVLIQSANGWLRAQNFFGSFVYSYYDGFPMCKKFS